MKYFCFFFKEEDNKELKKNEVKEEDNTGFMILRRFF